MNFQLAGQNIKGVIAEIVSVLSIINPLLFALAFFVFFWGLTKFILHSDSQADIQKGKEYMFWGVIALFVLTTFRVIIILVGGDLGLGTTGVLPSLPTNVP